MNQLVLVFVGVVVGVLASSSFYKPDELKSNLSAKEATLNQCQISLEKANQQITGMLMNK